MNTQTVITVLTSASVSAFVALMVEWAAKPRLEARKERILAVERARWAAIAGWRLVLMRLTMLEGRNPWPRGFEREQYTAEMVRYRKELLDQTRLLQDHLALLGPALPTYGHTIYALTLGTVIGAAGSQKTNVEVIEESRELVEITCHVLENSRGKYIGRVFSRRRAKAYIEANRQRLVARDSIIGDLAGKTPDGASS